MSASIAESSPEVIASFMQQVILEYQQFGVSHRRAEPRESVAVPLQVQPLDQDLRPLGDSFHAVSRDLSFGGIGLFHTHRVDADYMLIGLKAPQTHLSMQLLVKVEHCTPCGGLFIIGCRFASSCRP